MPKPRQWNKHEIKAEIVRRGVTFEELGRMYGLSGAMIRMSISRSKPLTTADQAIADFVGIPMHVLWPDRYDDKGHRLVKVKPLKAIAERRKRSPARAVPAE